MKKYLKIIVTIMILLSILVALSGCGNKNGIDVINKNNSGTTNNKWEISINSHNITLPCKLSELTKIGLKIENEYNYNQIVNSQNKTFTTISASSEGWKNGINVLLEIVTGNDSSKKEENAMVTRIENSVSTDLYGKYDISKSTTIEQFHLKNNISIGSTKEDVLNAFGDNYEEIFNNKTIRNETFESIRYSEGDNKVVFQFKGGKTTFIYIMNDKE